MRGTLSRLVRFLRGSSAEDRRITRAVGQATRVIMAKLADMERRMDTKINELLDVVEKQNTKIDSYQALFASMHERYLAAIGSDNLTPSQKMRMQQVLDAANKNVEEIDAALAANTDAEAQQATVGAVTTGPSAAEIKSGVTDFDHGPGGLKSAGTLALACSPAVGDTFTDPLPNGQPPAN